MADVRLYLIDGDCLSVRMNMTKKSAMNLLADTYNYGCSHLRFEENGLIVPANSILYIEVDEDAD